MNEGALATSALDGLWLALRLLLPLVLTGAMGGILAGALAGFLGLQDGLASRTVRSLVVIGALTLGLGLMGETVRDFAASTWGAMASVDGSNAGAR